MFTTAEITLVTRVITTRDGDDLKPLTNRRVGRVLGQMRLEKVPRPGGRGSRRWRFTLGDLERWTAAYGMLLPPLLTASGANGTTRDNDP